MDDKLETANKGINLVQKVIEAAGNNPDAAAAGSELGKTALTLTKAINNALLPLAAINFGFDRFRTWFEERFRNEMANKLANIPEDQVVEPKASIAGPALQGLAFSYEEPDLKEMYLTLLASAMDGRVAAKAHPAFVEIIRQLSADEARNLRNMLAFDGRHFPIVEVRSVSKEIKLPEDCHLTPGLNWMWTGGQQEILIPHLWNSVVESTKDSEVDSRMPSMVDNWIRLGLVVVDYNRQLAREHYRWINSRPEIARLREALGNGPNQLAFNLGMLTRTSLGEQFARSVGILPAT